MRWWWAIVCATGAATAAAPAAAAPCKAKVARVIGHATKSGQLVGKLKQLRKKDGKTVELNTSLADHHATQLTLRWPARVRPESVHSMVLDVAAKKLMRSQAWFFDIRDYRRKKWIQLGALSWKDGGADKSYALRTVDVNFYRDKRGRIRLRLRSEDVGALHLDRLRLRLRCSGDSDCCGR